MPGTVLLQIRGRGQNFGEHYEQSIESIVMRVSRNADLSFASGERNSTE